MQARLAAFPMLAALACAPALAQSLTAPQGTGSSVSVVQPPPDPDSPQGRALAEAGKKRKELERELYKLRATYFRNIRNVEIRQAGIAKLREYTDPAVFPSLLKVFKRDKDDVRGTILDMLAEQKSDEADATLAWSAVTDEDPWFRGMAADRLVRRVGEAGGEPSVYVQSVVARGLKSELDREINAAANLAQALNLIEAIPMLINAQVQGAQVGGAGAGGGGGDTSLAYILVGTQTAFVSDLEPVVADSAVAFDPTLSVVTDGVVLRVLDAVVVTYRTEVHSSLVGLSSKAWGRPTNGLGWDVPAWHDWYTREFKPYWDAKEAERKAEAEAPKPGETPADPTQPKPPGGG